MGIAFGLWDSVETVGVWHLIRRRETIQGEYVHESIPGAADDQRAVTDKVDAADRVGVCRKRAHHARGADVPEEDGFIVGAADKDVAPGRDGDGVDVVVMAEERYRMLLALRVNTLGWELIGRVVEAGTRTVATCHSRMDLSSEPEASNVESGLQAMVEIPARWPSRVCSCFPVAASHILIVPSAAIAVRLSVVPWIQRTMSGIACTYSSSQSCVRQAST